MFGNLVKIIVVLFSISLSAQNEMTEFSNPDLIKHQVGIGIAKFVNSAFSSDVNAYDVAYRYKYSKKTSLRAGISYEKDNSEDGFIAGGLKIGMDRQLRKYNHWTYYYGIDLFGNYSNYKNINRDIYSFGVAPLLGIQFYLSPNFSISIEPMLYLKYNIVVDHSTFEKNNTTEWAQSGLGQLGHIQLNFHF